MITLLRPDQLPKKRVHLWRTKHAPFCGISMRLAVAVDIPSAANCPHCLRVYDLQLSNQQHTTALTN